MKTIIVIYLSALLFLALALTAAHVVFPVPLWWKEHAAAITCAGMGFLGGGLYCLRAVYLNQCVFDRWAPRWHIWYFIRPWVSLFSGFVSYVFLKAGLLVLEATTKPDAVPYGYLAVAFIAGYNVDNFLKKVEDIASTTWGITKSRAAEEIAPSLASPAPATETSQPSGPPKSLPVQHPPAT